MLVILRSGAANPPRGVRDTPCSPCPGPAEGSDDGQGGIYDGSLRLCPRGRILMRPWSRGTSVNRLVRSFILGALLAALAVIGRTDEAANPLLGTWLLDRA